MTEKNHEPSGVLSTNSATLSPNPYAMKVTNPFNIAPM